MIFSKMFASFICVKKLTELLFALYIVPYFYPVICAQFNMLWFIVSHPTPSQYDTIEPESYHDVSSWEHPQLVL